MNASTRLYARLGEIPEDPNDPESLADLVVCAFGAFERYYVCWKTRGGQYRQDGHDLPTALKEWLYVADGTTRDFASLQVVFGRGEEYFASDKYAKLEYKEPEVKKPGEDEDKNNRMLKRRSRTVSFLRPLSETNIRPERGESETEANRQSRSFSLSSQRAPRPPALSYSSLDSGTSLRVQAPYRFPSTIPTRSNTQPTRDSEEAASDLRATRTDSSMTAVEANSRHILDAVGEDSSPALPLEARMHDTGRTQMLNVRPQRPSLFNTEEVSSLVKSSVLSTENPTHCTCGCHISTIQTNRKSTYVDASAQTESSRRRTPPPIDTSVSRTTPSDYSAVSGEVVSPSFSTNPVFMGRMMNYFSKPGYQLGDSLMSGYDDNQPIVYQYQDEFNDEESR